MTDRSLPVQLNPFRLSASDPLTPEIQGELVPQKNVDVVIGTVGRMLDLCKDEAEREEDRGEEKKKVLEEREKERRAKAEGGERKRFYERVEVEGARMDLSKVEWVIVDEADVMFGWFPAYISLTSDQG